MAKKGMMQAAPGELEEMDERKAALWSEGCVDSVTGEQRLSLQARYAEVIKITKRPLPEGDFTVYMLTVKTNKPLDLAEANEALRRGFAAESRKTSSRTHRVAKPYRCGGCSKIAGYPVKVAVHPCPGCAARRRKTGLS